MNARTTSPHGVAFGSEFGGGISFREYVATQFHAALLSSGIVETHGFKPYEMAEAAVVQADALIAELSKPQKKED